MRIVLGYPSERNTRAPDGLGGGGTRRREALLRRSAPRASWRAWEGSKSAGYHRIIMAQPHHAGRAARCARRGPSGRDPGWGCGANRGAGQGAGSRASAAGRPRDLLRRLPNRRNDCSGSGPKLSVASTVEPALAPPLASPPASVPVAAPAAPPSVAVRPEARSGARLEPIAPERHVLRVTVGPEFVANLEAVRQALSHKLPGGGLEEVLHACLRVTLAQVERRRFGAGKTRSATESPSGSRYVPVTVRKEVWKRDGGCCAFVGSTGRRCDSRHQVQPHHLDPFAMRGRATAANLTLRCRVHNHHAAEQDYGAEHIARKVASRRARRNASTLPTIPGLFGQRRRVSRCEGRRCGCGRRPSAR